VPGGIGTYVRGLVQGLERLGDARADVTLLTSRSGAGQPVAGAHPRVVRSRLPEPVLTRAWARGLVNAPEGHDVVHAPSLAAPPCRSAPLAVVVHDLAWVQVPDAFPRRGRRWHHAALRRAMDHATVLVAQTTDTADALLRLGARADQVEVLQPLNGCDHLPPADTAGAEALLDRLGVRGPCLLSVGTLEPRKNLGRLMEGYQRARPQLPEPWPLVVVGPPGWGRGVEPCTGVVMAGVVDDAVLAALYARARCVVYVPLVEGFGLPAVEAMMAAVPVVASPMPSTGGAALEVDPLDVVAIGAGLARASTDERLRSQLVTAGLVRARELTWEAAAARHVELWETLA
jgi:glycosyltransferase involved in cell wall biosynthesis